MPSIQITVRSISDSGTIEYHVRKHYDKLMRMYRKIRNCRVVIDVPQNHKHKGKLFSISIDITIPGKERISRKQSQNLYIAIRDGFSAIEKLLEKNIKRRIISLNKYYMPPVEHNTQSNNRMMTHD